MSRLWTLLPVAILALGAGRVAYAQAGLSSDSHFVMMTLWFFGADVAIAALLLSHVLIQRSKNEAIEKGLREMSTRLAAARGIVDERRPLLASLVAQADGLRQRTITLRDCDEDHERRLEDIERKLFLARERAVARLALRGVAWEDDATSPPDTNGGGT